MNRITRGGVHYINELPVAESVFGNDPFEPVRYSSVSEIIAEQVKTPVIIHGRPDCNDVKIRPGIQVYDAETDEDLVRIGHLLGSEGLNFSAGCAGFAAVLADFLKLNGSAPHMPSLPNVFFVACGSVNPVTLRQMRRAEEDGFIHIHLKPVQKLETSWLESEDCCIKIKSWLEQAKNSGRFILDVNDPVGSNDTEVYTAVHNLTKADLRIRISSQMANLMKLLLDGGLNATILCTGGDTLLALMQAIGVTTLVPVRELFTGVVLTNFVYHGKVYYIISKSGGFGEADLYCKLADFVEVANYEEDTVW